VPLAAAFIGLLSLATIAGGIALFAMHARVSGTQYVLVPAGVVLLACALVLGRTARTMWRRGDGLAVFKPWLSWPVAGRLVLGLFACYGIALLVGPAHYLEFGLLAAMVAWVSLVLLPLAAAPGRFEAWTAWLRHRMARRTERLVVGTMLVIVAAELALQGARLFEQRPWLAAMSPATDRAESLVALAPLPGGPLRVALLTDAQRRDCHGEHGCQTHIERALPGVEIVPIAVTAPWSNMPVNEVLEQFAAAEVDVVLAMLTVCDEVTRDQPETSWFDWRQLELARLVGAQASLDQSAPVTTATAADFESFCGLVSPQLAACRTPIDETMRARWQETFDNVDQLTAGCRAAGLPLTLVLVPGEFQLNSTLRDTLARRAGYAPDQLDVELPQRKLAGYAAARRLPLIDLLPTLRLCRESPYQRHAERFSNVGHQATAAAIGGWLESRYGDQLAATQLTVSP
jgi:hypothetical protein